MFVSVTRLRVRSIVYLPQFLWYTFTIERQTERAPGLIGVRLLVDFKRTYWTLTSWESEKAMKAFRGAAPHSKAMKKLPEWCDEAAYTHWTEDAPRLPDWTEAYERFIHHAKLSKVQHPSEAHQRLELRQPNLNSRLRRDFAA
jgi:heme-degrading monooxygenase HmoA